MTRYEFAPLVTWRRCRRSHVEFVLLATVDAAAAAFVAELATIMAPRPTLRVLGGVVLVNLLFGVLTAWGML